MDLKNASCALGLALTAAVISFGALAGDEGWYFGGSEGQARATIDDARIVASLQGSGNTVTLLREHDREFGFKLFGGYQFMRGFALEGGYFSMGTFDFLATTSPAGSLHGSLKTRGAFLEPVLSLPLSRRFSLFARGGANYAETESDFSGSGTVIAPADGSNRGLNYKFGFGAQYDYNYQLGIRAEAERYRIDDSVGNKADVDLLSLGVIFRLFGKDRDAYVAREAYVAPVEPAPVAPAYVEPVLVIVPAPAKARYCSILDIQFEINKDEIQREEKEKLGVVATFLKKYPQTTAVIEGHSDDIGNPEENLQLSQRRAESVVQFLQDTHRIAPSRLSAVGYGDTRPVADNDTDEGKRLNRRINAVIACATDIAGLTVVPARLTMAMLIEFEPNKADVRSEYRPELAKVARFMKVHPEVTATVEGHTGNLQATPELAMKISQLRAQNVVNYLVDELGVARSRLTAQGFGQTRRFAYNTSDEGQQDNRRVNIIFNYPR